MNTTDQSTNLHVAQPIPNSQRMLAPDLGRGFMLLLIVIAHAPLYLFTTDAFVMSRPAGTHFLDDLINVMGLLFVDNRAYPMFAALFGFGLSLTIQRQLNKGLPRKQIKKLVRSRSWWLILFGMIHFVVIGGADILAVYGVSGLAISWLLFRSDRTQKRVFIGLSLFYLIILPIIWGAMVQTNGPGLPNGLPDNPTYISLVKEHATLFPGFLLINLFMYPILISILMGVGLRSKQWLEHPHQFRSLLKRVTIIGLSISTIGALPLALVYLQLLTPSAAVLSGIVVIQIVTGLAGGLGYTALIALLSIYAQRIAPKVTWLLTAVGKRSLTFYLYQEILLIIILSPIALGFGGYLGSFNVFIVAVLIWLSAIFIGGILEQKNIQGPADALLRKLIYKSVPTK